MMQKTIIEYRNWLLGERITDENLQDERQNMQKSN
jgi:hypothetical protein